jgi:hypothetical protein
VSTLLQPPVSAGCVFSFSYPTDNRFRVSTRLRRRRFVIESVRDCKAEPIEPWAVELRPDLRRGQLLVTGHDLDRYGVRSFYVESMRSLKEISVAITRLAVYDPCSERNDLRWFGPAFTDAKADLEMARRALQRIRAYNDSLSPANQSRLSVGLFRYEMRAPIGGQSKVLEVAS